MRKCPVCDIELISKDYEGFRLMQCDKCGGHLVSAQRLESLKRLATKDQTELQADASTNFKHSTTNFLRCPRCHLMMEKESIDIPVVELQTDTCRSCKLIWLDGGELALLQLLYQSNGKFADAQEFRRRMDAVEASPERKAKFEADLAKLPDHVSPTEGLLNDFGETLLDALSRPRYYNI